MYNELSPKMIGNVSFSFYKIYMQTMLFFRGSFSFSPWPWGCSGHSVKNPKPQKTLLNRRSACCACDANIGTNACQEMGCLGAPYLML